MFILDKPYVSDLLKSTIISNKFPILNTSSELFDLNNVTSLDKKAVQSRYANTDFPKIYSNSENAINWISENLKSSKLPEIINAFKDKIKFRDLTHHLFPSFYFKGVAFNELNNIDITSIPKPFIIKPSIGFFSMGVYKVESDEQWTKTLEDIHNEMQEVKNLYPTEVMDSSNFIIEECIEGNEYAFDAYFNEQGEVVILGVFKHLFSSGKDMSDRVYFTSKEVIEEFIEPFKLLLEQIGDKIELKNFPLHAEVRINDKGEIIPIEINPMRFGGWCTTADLTSLAFNLNPYEYYYKQQKPNWDNLLQGKQNLRYCIVILNNSTGYSASEIKSFNYDLLLSKFTNTLELRKLDWHSYPLFGMLFTETHIDNFKEIEEILVSNLREFAK